MKFRKLILSITLDSGLLFSNNNNNSTIIIIIIIIMIILIKIVMITYRRWLKNFTIPVSVYPLCYNNDLTMLRLILPLNYYYFSFCVTARNEKIISSDLLG